MKKTGRMTVLLQEYMSFDSGSQHCIVGRRKFEYDLKSGHLGAVTIEEGGGEKGGLPGGEEGGAIAGEWGGVRGVGSKASEEREDGRDPKIS
jgi:hypothetical protein